MSAARGTYRALAAASLAVFVGAVAVGFYESLRTTQRPPPLPIFPKAVVRQMLKGGDYERAATELEATLRLDPERADLLAMLGLALSKLDRSEEAVVRFRQAVSRRPEDRGLRILLVTELSELGRYEEAAQQYRVLVALAPGDAELRSNLGYALERSGEVEAAVQEYRAAQSLDPDLVQPSYNLGRVLLERGDPAGAVPPLENAARLRPGLGETHALLGKAYRRLGRYDAAIASYRRALEIDPWRRPARRGLIAALLAANRRDEVVPELDTLLQSDPDDAVALNNLAWLLATDRDGAAESRDQAVAYAERSVAIAPDVHALDTLAIAYASAGRFDDAVVTGVRAVAAAETAGDDALAAEVRGRLERYRAGESWWEE